MADNISATLPEWTVLYHMPGKFKGRGEFLRLMLEDKGITSYENTDENLYGPKGIMDMFRGADVKLIDDDSSGGTTFPCLYPPAILHRPPGGGEEVLINQVGACVIYLGDVLGYSPTTSVERARANAVLLNALDYIADGRRSFHPVKDAMSYNDQKEEGDRISKQFSQERMPKFLHHFDKVIRQNGPTKPVAGGGGITYADFALFHVLDATANQFNSDHYDNAWDKTDLPAMKGYYEWMKDRPNLKAYFASDRCAPFAGDSMM